MVNAKLNFTVTSSTVPYVEVLLNSKVLAFIPAGRMLNVMEKIINSKRKVTIVGDRVISMTYDPLTEKFYIEDRSEEQDDVIRSESTYKLKRYIDLYKSIIDLIKNISFYYAHYKVFGITLSRMEEVTMDSLVDGSSEIYIAKSVQDVYCQFNEVHPYLLDNVEQCQTRVLHPDEVVNYCNIKTQNFIELI